MASRPNVADHLNQKMNVETAIDAITDYCSVLDLAKDERWKVAERIIEQMGLNLRQRVAVSCSAHGGGRVCQARCNQPAAHRSRE